MSVVTKISLQHIRSHTNNVSDISPTVTVVTGRNGSGKTSLIEAIYIALHGSSYKGSDSEVLQLGSPWWRIDIQFDDGSKRTVRFDPTKETGRKQFTIDDSTNYRLLPKHKYPVVLFEPDDLRLLHGSPTRRRQYIDRFISQLDPVYHTAIRKYERALKQRNNLLKQSRITADDVFVWDVTLSEYGAYIIDKRTLFIEQINSTLNDAYNDIAGSKDTISVHYSHTLIGDTKQKLLNELHQHFARDRTRGTTTTGPHRHDVVFEFNALPALSVASRGEARTIVLALKFLEVSIIEQITGKKPIILLDDVFSELDDIRQKALSDHVRDNQIIITSTHVLSGSKNYTHIQL